jgi:hypothetical protein
MRRRRYRSVLSVRQRQQCTAGDVTTLAWTWQAGVMEHGQHRLVQQAGNRGVLVDKRTRCRLIGLGWSTLSGARGALTHTMYFCCSILSVWLLCWLHHHNRPQQAVCSYDHRCAIEHNGKKSFVYRRTQGTSPGWTHALRIPTGQVPAHADTYSSSFSTALLRTARLLSLLHCISTPVCVDKLLLLLWLLPGTGTPPCALRLVGAWRLYTFQAEKDKVARQQIERVARHRGRSPSPGARDRSRSPTRYRPGRRSYSP